MRKLAAIGFLLVAAMQVVFALTGSDRAFPYVQVQLLSAIASLTLVWGAWNWSPTTLTIGFALNALTSIVQPILGLSRLPLWLNVIFATGWVLAALRSSMRRDPQIGLWILGFGYAISVFLVFGRLTAAIALTITAAGLFLAAPNTNEHQRLAR